MQRSNIYHRNALVPKQPSNSLKRNYCHPTNIHVFQRRQVKPSQHRVLVSPGESKGGRSHEDGEAFGGGGCRSDQHRFIVRGGFDHFKETAFERNIFQLSRSSKTNQGMLEPCWRLRPYQVCCDLCKNIFHMHPLCTQKPCIA